MQSDCWSLTATGLMLTDEPTDTISRMACMPVVPGRCTEQEVM